MQSSHTVVLHTILTGWTGRPASLKARTMHTVVLQSRHHGAVLTLPSLRNQRPNGFRLLDDDHEAVLTHHRPCETSLTDRQWNIPMPDHEWQAMNAEPRSRDHSPWTLYRTGLFTAHVPRSRIHRCGPAFAGRGEGRLPSSGDWQMRLFIGRARLCPSCGYLPSFADS